jgi:hypothetical protein
MTAPVMYLAATLSLVGGIIHLWVMPEHFEEWWGYGAFFLVLAIFEGLYAGALLNRPGRMLFILGMVVRISVITLYLVTRTVGVPPMGSYSGHIEVVALVDLIAMTANIALILALAGLLYSCRSPERVDKSGLAKDRFNS